MNSFCASMVTIDEGKVFIQHLNGFANLTVSMLRLDELHPVISGNKWYKLKHNLLEVKEKKLAGVLTLGGAWSNHLAATAGAAKEAGVKAVAIVRGFHGKESLTPTLQHCMDDGMELQFVSREEYSLKEDPVYLRTLQEKYPHFLIIPYGGRNEAGRKGAAEIATLIPSDYTHVCCSVGSGTTFMGLRNTLPSATKLIGFVPMKKGIYLKEEMQPHLSAPYGGNWELVDEFHFGGFGKWNVELLGFMNEIVTVHQLPLDVVYTSKMMYGVRALIQRDFFPINSKILCVHSGGLQGNASVAQQLIF